MNGSLMDQCGVFFKSSKNECLKCCERSLFLSQDSPFWTCAAQRFTTIWINLQMWLSAGFEVTEFAFLLDPCVNVSKWLQRTRVKLSHCFDLQIHSVETISPEANRTKTVKNCCTRSEGVRLARSLCAGWRGADCFMAQGRSSVCFRAHVNSSFVFLELQMSVCGASFSLMWAGALGDSQGDLCGEYRCQLEK